MEVRYLLIAFILVLVIVVITAVLPSDTIAKFNHLKPILTKKESKNIMIRKRLIERRDFPLAYSAPFYPFEYS